MGEWTRTGHGVPSVRGDSVEEVARLQGHVTALDRAWQLEHGRLRALGLTASVLGPGGLPWDRFVRRAGIAQTARRAYDALLPETRRFVDAYVEGVNAGLDEVRRPPELEVLEVEPGHWEPWMPLASFLAQHVLFSTFPVKLWRHHVLDVLGGSWGAQAAALFHHEGLLAAGSNAWAVGGDRSATGLPLVAGDPHRNLEAPNVYAQVRLACPGLDVLGFTFVGVPGVQHFAHAGSVAWGITNAMADYQDLYLERPADLDAAEVRCERIPVRGAEEEALEVLTTQNGPVVVGGRGEPFAFSLRTPSYVLGRVGFDCLLPLLRSRTAADVEEAFAGWVEPVNNVVVADDRGDVRRFVTGRVPLRHEANRWLPVPGWDARHGWTGWVGPLPRAEVPADGQVVTANHRMPGFERIGTEFAPPCRAERITVLLAGRDRLTVDDLAAVDADTLRPVPDLLLDAVLDLRGLAAPAEGVRSELEAWDRRMARDSRPAAVYGAVRAAFVERLSRQEPFARLREGSPYGELFDPWFVRRHRLNLAVDNVLSAGVRLGLDLEPLLRAALDDVAGQDHGTWGEHHRYAPLHALGGPAVDAVPLGGDLDCVLAAAGVPGRGTAVRGPVARYVWDLADRDRSRWVVPMGVSGDPRSPHHHDQLDTWASGGSLPVAPGD